MRTKRLLRLPAFCTFLMCCGCAALLSGCANLAPTTTTATQFAQSAHTLATTEDSFFHAVKAADCNSQFYNAALAYAVGTSLRPNTSSECKPTILTDQEITLRKAALDAISAYADKIAAVAGGNDTAFDTSAKTLAADVNKRLPGDKGIKAGVEAAILELANIALDERRFTDIASAANAAAPSLDTLVVKLQSENTTFSAGIESKIGGLEVNLETILRTEHGARAFFDAAQARIILQAANPFTGPAAVGAAQESAESMAVKLNTALSALVTANHALASAKTTGLTGAVQELVARAKDAQALYAALNK